MENGSDRQPEGGGAEELNTTAVSVRKYKGVRCGTREGKETERWQCVENEGGSRVKLSSLS